MYSVEACPGRSGGDDRENPSRKTTTRRELSRENRRVPAEGTNQYDSLLVFLKRTWVAVSVLSFTYLALGSRCSCGILLDRSLAGKAKKGSPRNTAALSEQIDQLPDDFIAYIELGRSWYEAGRFNDARGVFEAAIERFSGIPDVFEKLGDFYREQGDQKTAEKYYLMSIESSETLDSYNLAYIRLGWVYREQGRLEEAENLFQKAENQLERFLRNHPNDEDAYLELGIFYCDLGRLEEAAEAQKKAIEINPHSYKGYLGLSRTLKADDRDEDALNVLKRAVAVRPECYEAYIDLASVYTRLDRAEERDDAYHAAEKALLRLVKNEPKNETAYMELGEMYRSLGRFDDAEKMLAKSIEMDPTAGRAKEKLGRIYMELGEYKKAEVVLSESAEEDPHNGCAFQALGVLYTEIGEPNKAIENLKALADRGPFVRDAQTMVAEACFQAGDYPCALEYIERAIERDDQPRFHLIKGYTQIMLKHYTEAKKTFGELKERGHRVQAASGYGHLALIGQDYSTAEKFFLSIVSEATEEGGDNPLLHDMTLLGLGWVYANQNEHSRAIEYFEAALKDRPDQLLAVISKANSLLWLGDSEQALEIYNRALELSPDNKYILEGIGLARYNLGEYDAAEESFKRSLKNSRQPWTCPYEGLGLVYFKQGKFDEAKRNLEKSIDLNPDIEFKKYNTLAKIYIEEGKLDKARTLLEKSIENYPYNEEAQRLLDEMSAPAAREEIEPEL